jgi:hypothetical protein
MGGAEGSLSRRSAEAEEIINWIHHGDTEATEKSSVLLRVLCVSSESQRSERVVKVYD